MNLSLSETVMTHIRASGPVTFNSILAWVRAHHPKTIDDYLVAKELTSLIRSGQVELYETGDSFDVATVGGNQVRSFGGFRKQL